MEPTTLTGKTSYESLISNYSFDFVVPTWYNNLPIEVLVRIFKNFSERELRQNIIPVCQHWRYAALRPKLWKKLKIVGRNVPVNFICRKLRVFPQLESIYLTNVTDSAGVIRQICRCTPNVKHLTIRHSAKVAEVALRNLIYCCKRLESLDFSNTEFKGYRVYEELATLPHLRSLNLSGNRHLTIRNLMGAALNCQKLEELRISKWLQTTEQLTDEDAAFMLINLAGSLKSLSLDAMTLTNITFLAILKCNKLERLSLCGAANLTGDTFTKIWKHLPKINKLKIKCAHQITGEHVVTLFYEGENVMKQLVLLDLTGCWKITDEGIAAIAKCCPKLKQLILKRCKSITNITPILEMCKALEELNVAFCTNLSLNPLPIIPRQLKTLIIEENDKYINLLETLKAKTSNIEIKLSISEYNNIIKKLNH